MIVVFPDHTHLLFIIEEVKQAYEINLQGKMNIPNEDIMFKIKDELFLETLLCIIRAHTIRYS